MSIRTVSIPALVIVGRVVARKLLRTALVLLGVLVLVFLVVRLVPGDPAVSILGEQAPEEELARLRVEMGLDLPLATQFGRYLSSVLDGSLGHAMSRAYQGATVSNLIADVFPFTMELALIAILVAAFIALPLGVWSALRRNGVVDRLALAGTLLGVAMPGFWLGPLLIYLFCVYLRVLPDPASGVLGAASLVLPCTVLGLALSAKLTRMVRSSVLDTLQRPFVRAAWARGIPNGRVVVRHVLRNALIPVVTVLGLQLAALLSGAIITEKVFARPGIGTLLLEGIALRDYAIVQGTAIFIGLLYVLINLAVDLLYVLVDPQILRTFRTAREGQ